ncbi:Hsp70 family protein [Micromonospora sp. NPDC049559]|uniref:Hsp70 family protein n=1 Tax=Micromonospora sp. NPDC049559 TaxID=3155923 RepID=UPI003429ECA4
MLRRSDGSVTPLLFDSSPLLASAVYTDAGGTVLTGADAERAGAAQPAGLEPNPKRRVDDGTLWLGEREVPLDELIAAVFARVATEARRVSGASSEFEVRLTHPAAWGRSRLDVLTRAAGHAGLTEVGLVPEPVAAAAYFATELDGRLPPGRCVVVYDLGAGTFDVSVVRRTERGFEVLFTDGLPDVGGLDLDATVVAHARSLTVDAPEWGRLNWPENAADQRARWLLWQGARAAKEQLSRHATAPLHVPLVERDFHLTREEFEAAARPHLARTVELTRAALRSAGVAREQIGGLFLVGGSSRVPLAATLLRRELGIAPTVIDQPELVVARGGLYADPTPAPPASTSPASRSTSTSAPTAAPEPAPAPATPAPAPTPTPAPEPAPAPQAAPRAASSSGPPSDPRPGPRFAPGSPPASSPATTPPAGAGSGGARVPLIWIGGVAVATVALVALVLGFRLIGDRPPDDLGTSPTGGTTSGANASGGDRGARAATVDYRVTGTGAVNIVYTDEHGAPKTLSGVPLPWQQRVEAPNHARVEVHAFGVTGRPTGDLTCHIAVNGQEVTAKHNVGAIDCATTADG